MTTNNEQLLTFLHIDGIINIVNDYTRPLKYNDDAPRKFKLKLTSYLKRVLLKGVDKTLIKNNKLKIKIHILEDGNIIVDLYTIHKHLLTSTILQMSREGYIWYENLFSSEVIGSIYDKNISIISKYLNNNNRFRAYLKHVRELIENSLE